MRNHCAIGADPAFVLDKPDAVERPGPHAACEKINKFAVAVHLTTDPVSDVCRQQSVGPLAEDRGR
jgi:hypothetical protein